MNIKYVRVRFCPIMMKSELNNVTKPPTYNLAYNNVYFHALTLTPGDPNKASPIIWDKKNIFVHGPLFFFCVQYDHNDVLTLNFTQKKGIRRERASPCISKAWDIFVIEIFHVMYRNNDFFLLDWAIIIFDISWIYLSLMTQTGIERRRAHFAHFWDPRDVRYQLVDGVEEA